MSGISSGESQQIIAYILSRISKEVENKNEAELISTFAERYFLSTSGEDLKEHTLDELYHLFISHWKLINQRKKDQALIRVWNPDLQADGWESRHTVIEVSFDDVPFLVDSIRMVINKYGLQIHFIVHFGGLRVKRNNENKILEFKHPGLMEEGITSEAPIYIEIDRVANENVRNEIKDDIERVLNDTKAAVQDWRKMVSRIEECLKELEATPPTLDRSELAESRDFLRWLINNNFTFLGARDYKLISDDAGRALQAVSGSGLGVLREELSVASSKRYSALPPQARKMALSKNILIIAKTNTVSTIHREAYTDYIGVKRFNEKGELIGERRFIGLYTSTAYNSSPRHIPFLRHKVDKVLKELGFPPDSHDGKEAVHILETLPRDDLFQASGEDLLNLTFSIIQLKERKKVRLLVRQDAFGRYYSCLVYVPRDIFNTNLAVKVQSILMTSLGGTDSSYTTYFSDSVLARIHYLVRVNPKNDLKPNYIEIEKKISEACRSWVDHLKELLIDKYKEAEGLRLLKKYEQAFSAGYLELNLPKDALEDIAKIESLSDEKVINMKLIQQNVDSRIGLKLYHEESNLVLSDVLPILENLGLKAVGERPYELQLHSGKKAWIHHFQLIYAGSKQVDIHDVRDIFEEAFTRIWLGEAENDGFNRLILEANLTWQETAMLRAYTKYLRQTGFTFSQNYIEQALIKNVEITNALVQLFVLRFDPHYQSQDSSNSHDLISFMEKNLDDVKSLDEDRILRRLLEVLQATTRTNYFQRDESKRVKLHLSFKFDPDLISDLPLPRPAYEIFVYSPRMEGIHLRAGKVARGGLRWSDRLEDFRTEVLGLMKAQKVKNTMIVPEGAKGGFVVKQPLSSAMSRDEYMKEVIFCYSSFISGMLDITDNIKDELVTPPVDVVRYDEDDPYLVVAADKGTATFSDIANGIAAKYDFWLGDAFASGGSAGYDHKKMGITSRGAWVSVERHFRELGINPDKDDFTTVGIGDMAGDVFGNGVLLSKHMKLIAAFNHMHIFLDPDPDALSSYNERKRLFNLPRSSWSDYNQELISKGGGVFERSAKSIKLSSPAKKALGITADSMRPNDLISAILKAPVDLIWNGGIGTFVKASTETDQDVGDRNNDSIRVNALDLRARVIAEGGNLGLTQAARIEYSLHGGIVNTDFIDNSAGVDCSDHEVNIKILLNKLVANGELELADRNKLLEEMTDEVASLVLQDNYEQNQMLSLEVSVSSQTIDIFRQYMTDLEKLSRLSRELEFLPDNATILERKANNQLLTRPEIAMLMAYSRMYLKKDILLTNIPEDPVFNQYLFTSFPDMLTKKYPEQIKNHSLRREIIATQVCKSITDRMGINFIDRLQRETGASIEFIIRSYYVVQHVFDMEGIWQEVVNLNDKVNPEIQYRMFLQIYYLIRRATRWFLRNRKSTMDAQKQIDEFSKPVELLMQHMSGLLDQHGVEAFNAATEYLEAEGVGKKLARKIACCNSMFTALDIIEASKKYDLGLVDIAKSYFLLGNKLQLNWLRELISSFAVDNAWDELARSGFRDDLDRVQRKLCMRVLSMKSKEYNAKSIDERINIWINRYQFLMERWQSLLSDLKSSESAGFVTFSVVLRELFDFAHAA